MRFGWGLGGMGCLLYPMFAALAILLLVLLLRLSIR